MLENLFLKGEEIEDELADGPVVDRRCTVIQFLRDFFFSTRI